MRYADPERRRYPLEHKRLFQWQQSFQRAVSLKCRGSAGSTRSIRLGPVTFDHDLTLRWTVSQAREVARFTRRVAPLACSRDVV